MSKLILCLFLLFSIYICEEPKNIRVFDSRKDMGKVIKIRPGEEFKLKLFGSPSRAPWILLNENEALEYLQLLRNFDHYEVYLLNVNGIRYYSYFHFKALKKTKEDLILKFRLNHNKIREELTFTINVE